MIMSNIKIWLFSLVLILIVALWDITSRLIPNVDANNIQKEARSLELANINPVTEDELASIIQLYSEYDKKIVNQEQSKSKPKRVGLPKEQQQQQNGHLDKLYIGNLRFNLKGIFTDEKRFAVLYQENLDTGKVDEISVVKGRVIGDYTVSNITEYQVVFEFADRKVQLSIF